MATYTSASSGLWSSGSTWVGGVTPPSDAGHRIIIASPHVVTYDGPSWEYGDDTTSAFTVNNGGALRFSRSLSTSLTVRGRLTLNGALDRGTQADPMPAGVTSTIAINKSPTMAHGKYGVATASTTQWSEWGASKTPYGQMSAVTSSTVFDMPDGAGWLAGDILFFGPTAPGRATTEVRAIQSITALGGTAVRVTLTAGVSNANFVGRWVANLTRNVKWIGHQPETWAAQPVIGGGTAATIAATIAAAHVECVGAGTASTTPQVASVLGTAAAVTALRGLSIHDVVSVSGSTVTTTTSAGLAVATSAVAAVTAGRHVEDSVFVTARGTRGSGPTSNNATARMRRCFLAGGLSGYGQLNGTGVAGSAYLDNCVIVGNTDAFSGGHYGVAEVTGGVIDACSRLTDNATAGNVQNVPITIRDCAIGQGLGIGTVSPMVGLPASNGILRLTLDNCTQPALDMTRQNALRDATETLFVRNIAANNSPSNQTLYKQGGEIRRDNTVDFRGTSSIRMDCWFAGVPLEHTVTVPVAAGQTINVRGWMRYTATYGTATPPRVTLSGLDATPVTAVCPTSGADTWHPFSVTITNPKSYPGNFTLTMTGESAANATGAFCYFDGVPNSPWIDSVRQYGYVYDSLAYRTADARFTLTESAALALPVAVNHTATPVPTITVTGALTASQVAQAAMADLAQTANQARGMHLTWAVDGQSFATTYRVVLGSGGSISGRYSDVDGAVVSVSLTGLVAGSRVLIKRTDTNAVMANAIAAGTSFSINVQTATAIPISVDVRKASSAPFYQPWATTGSIDPVGGFAATANQQPD